jgi:hypothetical protein
MENQNVDKYQGQLVTAKSIKDPDLPLDLPSICLHLTNLKIPPFLIMNHNTKWEQVKLIAMTVMIKDQEFMMTTIGFVQLNHG